MTGFSGRIMLEGHLDTAKSHLGTAMKLADKLNVWKKTQGISAVTKAYDLGDGSYCVVVDLAHMRAMQIVAPSVTEKEYETFEQILDRYEYTGVADVVSGKVPTFDDAQIITEQVEVEGEDGKPRTIDIKVLKDFEPTQKTAQRYSDVERRYRLNLPESPIFTPLGTQPDIVYSQHAHVKPSCYTGAMRKLVQFILGMGQVIRPTWEERWMEKNKKGYLPIKQKSIETNKTSETLSAFNLYYKKDVVKVLNTYDYRFAKTHGVSFDPDGKPYLIEISMRGVHAMPLYMDPVSLTVQGKKRYLDVSPELSHVFETFGGIPLGVNFPFTSGENTFNKWKRAGEILDLAPQGIDEFYSKYPYSSGMGWAINNQGTEAHNTCYSYRNDTVKLGFHYRLQIKIEKADALPELDGARAQLAARFTEVYKINKCRRMTDVDARILLLKYEKDEEEGDDAFDELEVKSNMKGSASLSLVNSGPLYYPTGNDPDAQPDIKFPEPMLNGLVSVDFRAEAFGVLSSGPTQSARCDTPIFVCMIGDSVEIVNYFYDSRRGSSGTTNTRGKCQYSGSWTISGSSSDPELKGHFYSNRWDFRTEMADSWSSSTYTGRKINTYGVAETKAFFAMCVWVYSRVTFFIDWTSSAYANGNLGVAVAVPFYDRNCYYMLREEEYGYTSSASGGYVQDVVGSHRQWWELYNFAFHWREPCSYYSLTPPIREGNSRCIARKLRDIHDESACVHAPLPAEIFYSVCPEAVFAGTVITVSAPLWNNTVLGGARFNHKDPPKPYSTSEQSGSSAKYQIFMVNDSGFGPIITQEQEVKLQQPVGSGGFGLSRSSWWWRFSPDKNDGTMPWMGVTQSCLGATVINYSKDMNSEPDSMGAPESMHGTANTCYTGVIE